MYANLNPGQFFLFELHKFLSSEFLINNFNLHYNLLFSPNGNLERTLGVDIFLKGLCLHVDSDPYLKLF